MVRMSDVVAEIDQIWPSRNADEWDNVGLLVGDPEATVSRVALAVDVTFETLAEAISLGAQLLITHHPLLLAGQKSVLTSTSIGNRIHTAIKSNLGILALHTNADHPEFGVSEALANALGLRQISALDADTGHGRVGDVAPQRLQDFAQHIAGRLPACKAPIRVAGDPERVVKRVAVLAGSGASFLDQAKASGVDVFVTSDLKHHPTLDFLSGDVASGFEPSLIDISHWAAESIWLEIAAERLRQALPALQFQVSELCTDPWTFCVQP